MKTMYKLMASAIVLMSFATITNAQSTATSSATATIVTPISIALTGGNLNFGNIAVGASGGTVVVAPNSGRTATGGLTLPPTNLGTVSAAQFTVTGNSLYTYAVTVPTTLTLTHTNTTDLMTASLFTLSTSAVVAGAGTGAIGAGGTQLLNVGATLTVAGAQLAGVYSNAAFPVTVNYN